jgi:hypothetical protein
VLLRNVATFSTSGTITATTSIVRLANFSSGFDLTLPATVAVGSVLTIKDVDGSLVNGLVRLLCQGSDRLEGTAVFPLTQPRSSVTIAKTATNEWSII